MMQKLYITENLAMTLVVVFLQYTAILNRVSWPWRNTVWLVPHLD